MPDFCILLCVGAEKEQMCYNSCAFCAWLLNILKAWLVINSLTFQKIIRCWPVSHDGSQIEQLQECIQKLPMSVIPSMHAVVTAPPPTLQIAFSQLKIPMGIPGFAHRMILLVCYGIFVRVHVKVEFSGAFAQKEQSLNKNLTFNVTVLVSSAYL